MKYSSISHSRTKETPEAKARWFQSLPLQDRMDLLCFYTDLILTNNPADYQGQVFRVVSREDLIKSKRASGREVDLEDVRLLELGNEK